MEPALSTVITFITGLASAAAALIAAWLIFRKDISKQFYNDLMARLVDVEDDFSASKETKAKTDKQNIELTSRNVGLQRHNELLEKQLDVTKEQNELLREQNSELGHFKKEYYELKVHILKLMQHIETLERYEEKRSHREATEDSEANDDGPPLAAFGHKK